MRRRRLRHTHKHVCMCACLMFRCRAERAYTSHGGRYSGYNEVHLTPQQWNPYIVIHGSVVPLLFFLRCGTCCFFLRSENERVRPSCPTRPFAYLEMRPRDAAGRASALPIHAYIIRVTGTTREINSHVLIIGRCRLSGSQACYYCRNRCLIGTHELLSVRMSLAFS